MKVITDTAANLTPERANELGVELVPFQITFMGKSYRDGIDISAEELYQLFSENPGHYPTTSQPSPGDFATLYEKYPVEEVISVHISSGLSGSYSSGVTASHLVSNECISVVDSRTLGPVQGWMVEVAAQGAKLGWARQRILEAMQALRQNSLTIFTIGDLKYLIHGGRIDHLQGLIGSLLKIKPLIGMNDADGRYITLGQEMTMSRALRKLVEMHASRFGRQKVRIQLAHGNNPAAVELLRTAACEMLDCIEESLLAVTPVLGAHTGPTLVGMAAMGIGD